MLAPEDYHYRRLITDAVRAVTAVRALPGVDPHRVTGRQQPGRRARAGGRGARPGPGGGAGHAPRSCAASGAPLDLTDAGPYGEIAAFLAVHRDAEDAAVANPVLRGRRQLRPAGHAPAHFGVGLRDTVCPPSAAFAAYNRYGELTGRAPRREIHTYPFNGHEDGDAVHVRKQLAWLRTVLNEQGDAGRGSGWPTGAC